MRSISGFTSDSTFPATNRHIWRFLLRFFSAGKHLHCRGMLRLKFAEGLMVRLNAGPAEGRAWRQDSFRQTVRWKGLADAERRGRVQRDVSFRVGSRAGLDGFLAKPTASHPSKT